jgi:hypothetical protein
MNLLNASASASVKTSFDDLFDFDFDFDDMGFSLKYNIAKKTLFMGLFLFYLLP